MAEKFIDKLKMFVGFDVDDEYDDEMDYEEEFEKPSDKKQKGKDAQSASYSKEFDSLSKSVPARENTEYRGDNINVTLYKPKSFNDAADVVDNLKARKPVVINLLNLDEETARKIFDFCSGAVYSLDGKISKVSNDVFLLAPSNVDIYTNIPNTYDEE